MADDDLTNMGSTEGTSFGSRLASIEATIDKLVNFVGERLGPQPTIPTPIDVPTGEAATPINPADIEHPPIGGAPHDDGSPPTGIDRLTAIESRLKVWEPAILDIVRIAGSMAPGSSLFGMLTQLAGQFGHSA